MKALSLSQPSLSHHSHCQSLSSSQSFSLNVYSRHLNLSTLILIAFVTTKEKESLIAFIAIYNLEKKKREEAVTTIALKSVTKKVKDLSLSLHYQLSLKVAVIVWLNKKAKSVVRHALNPNFLLVYCNHWNPKCCTSKISQAFFFLRWKFVLLVLHVVFSIWFYVKTCHYVHVVLLICIWIMVG